MRLNLTLLMFAGPGGSRKLVAASPKPFGLLSFPTTDLRVVAAGQLPGAAPRPDSISLSELSKHAGEDVNEYAPTTGVTALREAVAKYYNETYRKGKKSQ